MGAVSRYCVRDHPQHFIIYGRFFSAAQKYYSAQQGYFYHRHSRNLWLYDCEGTSNNYKTLPCTAILLVGYDCAFLSDPCYNTSYESVLYCRSLVSWLVATARVLTRNKYRH